LIEIDRLMSHNSGRLFTVTIDQYQPLSVTADDYSLSVD